MAKHDSDPGLGQTALIVVAILGIEIVLAMTALNFLGAEPTRAQADEPAPQVDPDRIIEVLVLDARLPNDRSGETVVYDTEIYVQVRARHEAIVRQELDQFANELRSQMISIWRTSEPHHFQEANLGTLTRRVTDTLRPRFDPTPDGEDVVLKCVVMSIGYRVG
jgi:hypothetical protein